MDNSRNRYGVKDSAKLYRTIGGEHYICWSSCASADQIRAYRKAGIKCSRRGGELFIREADQEMAAALDSQVPI